MSNYTSVDCVRSSSSRSSVNHLGKDPPVGNRQPLDVQKSLERHPPVLPAPRACGVM